MFSRILFTTLSALVLLMPTAQADDHAYGPIGGSETVSPNDSSVKAIFERGRRHYEAGDYTRSYELFLAAAKQGLPQAQMSVAYQLETGQGVMPNPSLAVRWYTRAADLGLPAALVKLALLYSEGKIVRRNPVLAHALVLTAHRLSASEVTEALIMVTLEGLTDEQAALATRLSKRMSAAPGRVSQVLAEAKRIGSPVFR